MSLPIKVGDDVVEQHNCAVCGNYFFHTHGKDLCCCSWCWTWFNVTMHKMPGCEYPIFTINKAMSKSSSPTRRQFAREVAK